MQRILISPRSLVSGTGWHPVETLHVRNVNLLGIDAAAQPSPSAHFALGKLGGTETKVFE